MVWYQEVKFSPPLLPQGKSTGVGIHFGKLFRSLFPFQSALRKEKCSIMYGHFSADK